VGGRSATSPDALWAPLTGLFAGDEGGGDEGGGDEDGDVRAPAHTVVPGAMRTVAPAIAATAATTRWALMGTRG
jgi:hypothetical protein